MVEQAPEAPAKQLEEEAKETREEVQAEPMEAEPAKPAEESSKGEAAVEDLAEERREEVQAAPMEAETAKPAEESPKKAAAVEDLAEALKRPKTAFWLFQAEMREQVMQEIGSKQGSKVVLELAAKWKALDDAARAVYTDKAKMLLERYQKDVANGGIPAQATKKAPAKGKGKKALKGRRVRASKTARALLRRGAAAPKKPSGSYSIWLTENRHKILAKLKAEGSTKPSFEEIARAAGKEWSALTPEQKAPFVERSRVLGDKYKEINKACKEYKMANIKDLKGKAKARARATKAKAAKAVAKKASKKSEKQQAIAAKKQEKEAKKQEKEAKKHEKEAKKQDTPKKRAVDASQLPTPTKKAAKKSAVSKPPMVYIDTVLEAEAEKLGMVGSFRRLAERDDMKKFAQRTLLDALIASEGLMHKAKDAVLATSA